MSKRAYDLFPITLDEQIVCVERELRYRRNVYPRRVADRKMPAASADKQIELMEAVLATLRRLRETSR